jgi:hypothetical protein
VLRVDPPPRSFVTPNQRVVLEIGDIARPKTSKK